MMNSIVAQKCSGTIQPKNSPAEKMAKLLNRFIKPMAMKTAKAKIRAQLFLIIAVLPFTWNLNSVAAAANLATPASDLATLPGFTVELLHSAAAEEGSWICMTIDPKGRLIISPQQNQRPLLRVTLNRYGKVAEMETIPAPVRQAMGMCYAHDSLYVNARGPQGNGLYRLIDVNHNDHFDTNEVRFLQAFRGEGEHGYHAVVEGPDKLIYVMNGNHTKLPEAISANSPYKDYGEDLLLPRQWDANGHAVGILAPGGYVVRSDLNGKEWELMLAGFRNSYDFDFNPDGEMFTFDSDMEWDWGLPWYKPTRIIHGVTGGEYGWRSGTSNEPEYYADTLPAAVDTGIGSPTGVKFGTKSRFPRKYQRALFAMDWSYGRIFAVHLKPQGASYTGDYEEFVKGKPLNVTDLEFGRDGAMYFITGGRGTQSGLYRVSHTGKTVVISSSSNSKRPERPSVELRQAAKARDLRKELESFHGRKDPRAIDFAWPHLASEDRFIRFAARVAVEWQNPELWKDKALKEKNPQAGLTALLALARCGATNTQNALLQALGKFPMDALDEKLQLEKLRVIQLSFIRQGRPDLAMARLVTEELNRQYPSTREKLNRELVQLLVYLEAPDVVAKTMALLDKAPTQEEQIHYIFNLRNLKSGWTLEQRKRYFNWFATARQGGRLEMTSPRGGTYNTWTNQALAGKLHSPELIQWFKEASREYADGSSHSKFLLNIRKDAIATLTGDEHNALGMVLARSVVSQPWKPSRERTFVQEWTMADLEPALDTVGRGRNFASGRAAFNDAQCIVCHRFGNEGGSVGPELIGAGSKYSRRDVLESILEPSRVISDQFQNMNLLKKDGDLVSGRIVDEDKDRVTLMPSMLAPDATVEIPISEIAQREASKVSSMPSGLLNYLTREEILDLLAYVESMGQAKANNFVE
jgi:putative heme-binding domain-containing protein